MKQWLVNFINWWAMQIGLPHRGLKYFIKFLKLTGLYHHQFIGKTSFGVKFHCHLYDHIERYIYWYGWYEEKESRFLLKILEHGMVMIDAGANIGYYSMMVAARSVGSQVFAFEPSSANANRLRKNIQLNNCTNVTVVPLALGNNNAVTTLYQSAVDNSGMTSLIPPENANGTTEPVQVIRLDDWAATNKLLTLDLIKIDIEGFELFALEGMADILTKFLPMLLIEIKKENMVRFGRHAADIYTFLENLGYHPFEINERPGLTKLENTEADIDLCVFVHSSKITKMALTNQIL